LINLTNAQQTFKLQHKTSNASDTVSSKNIGITAVKLSTMGTDGYTADVAGSSATSATYTPVTDASLSGTPSQYGSYLVFQWALLGGDSVLQKVYNQMVIDEIGHGETTYRPDDVTDRMPSYDTHMASYGPFLHTSRIDQKADGGAQVTTSDARLIAFKLNTLQSYRDAGVNENSTFDATNHTVYVYGYGYIYDYENNQAEDYHIAFYDNAGTQIASVAAPSVANRSINATYDLNTNQSAEAGTWHAVVYKDTVEATGKADSGSTITLVDSARTEADDYWNGWTLQITETTDGLAPQGESKTVTDFVASTDTITTAAFSVAIEAGDIYRLYKSVSPSATYSASDAKSFLELSFTVEALAIPEFSTVMASLVVVGICSGIYYWMRKKKIAHVKA